MSFSWFESLIYAFVAGVTEFLPVSSHAHRSILRHLFAVDTNTTVLDFLIHFAILLSVIFFCQSQLALMKRTRKLLSIPARKRAREPGTEATAKYKLVRAAILPVLIFTAFFQIAHRVADSLNIMAICLLVNGLVIYITGLVRTGNKAASQMSRVDGTLIGFISGLGIIPGFSRVGLGLSISHIRGASGAHAIDWVLLLSIPALIGLCITDLIVMFTVGAGTFTFLLLLKYLVSAFAAYAGAYLSMILLRHLAAKVGITWFAFYCWGAALFSFILFMI